MANKPNTMVSWTDKTKNKNQWFKEFADYYISASKFRDGSSVGTDDISKLYDAYNGIYDKSLFKHVTDPYSSNLDDKQPAKIRPIAMIRTNIDQLVSEYNLRPLRFMVVNKAPEAHDTYNQEMTQVLHENLMAHFNEALKAMGVAQDSGQETEVEVPEIVQKRMTTNFRDALAIQGQDWLEETIAEHRIKEILLQNYLHWLIVGEAYSMKAVYNGKLLYNIVMAQDIDYARNIHKTFVEDQEWVVARYRMSPSDIVALFYEEVKNNKLKSLVTDNNYSPQAFYNALTATGEFQQHDRVVYHVQWTAQKEVLIVEFVDPTTGQLVQEERDEDYKIADDEKIVDRFWVNEKYETWKVADDIYAFTRAVPTQRIDGGLSAKPKNSYNGRTFSPPGIPNTSIMRLGMPFQLMCMILNYKIEFLISKSKGKIVLLDKGVIPRDNGWTDDKFFHYADAKGWGLINRNQVGVDKSYNQYQVLDMSMYDNIKQLIDLYQYYKQQWDDTLGMTPPRKGQMKGTDDLVGTTKSSIYQSSVITDMINVLFEQYVERELEGLLDISRYAIAAEGEYKRVKYNDDYTYKLVSISPYTYCSHALGIRLSNSTKDTEILNTMKAQVANLIQNGAKASEVLTILHADNIAKLMQDLKHMESVMEQATAQQHENEKDILSTDNELKMEFEEFKAGLEAMLLDREWDRKDNNTMLQGEFNTYTFQDGDSNDNGVPDVNEIMERAQDRQLKIEENSRKLREMLMKDTQQRRELRQRERESRRKAETDRYKAKQAAKKRTLAK